MVTMNRAPTGLDLCSKYNSAQRRLIILGYDGVLVPHQSNPDLTVPSAELKKIIRDLQQDRRNTIVLITDRDKRHLEKYWFDTNLILVAENGSFFHEANNVWRSLFKYDASWVTKAAVELDALSSQFEGTFVEKRQTSVAWHYRTAKNKIGYSGLREVIVAIRTLVNSGKFALYHGEGFIELYTKGIDAGSFLTRWIGGRQYDFILSIGESRLDESMFGLFSQDSFLVRVSTDGFTHANYLLDQQEEVLPLLATLV